LTGSRAKLWSARACSRLCGVAIPGIGKSGSKLPHFHEKVGDVKAQSQ